MRSEANELKKLAIQNELYWIERWVNMRERWVEVFKSWRDENNDDAKVFFYIKNGRVYDCQEKVKEYPNDLYRCVREAIERMAAKAAKGAEQKPLTKKEG